jgi:hypothetical protein
MGVVYSPDPLAVMLAAAGWRLKEPRHILSGEPYLPGGMAELVLQVAEVLQDKKRRKRGNWVSWDGALHVARYLIERETARGVSRREALQGLIERELFWLNGGLLVDVLPVRLAEWLDETDPESQEP